jgi:hypothetical protein
MRGMKNTRGTEVTQVTKRYDQKDTCHHGNKLSSDYTSVSELAE